MKKKAFRHRALVATIVLLVTGTCFIFMGMISSDHDKVKVHLLNKCAKPVSISVESPGNHITYTIESGETKTKELLDGAVIYDGDDKIVHTVSLKSEGTTVVVCE